MRHKRKEGASSAQWEVVVVNIVNISHHSTHGVNESEKDILA